MDGAGFDAQSFVGADGLMGTAALHQDALSFP